MEEQGDWFEQFEYLRKYVEQKGHARVPKSYITDNGFKLGAWVVRQRSAYRNKKLSSNAKKRLQELPGWIWNIRKFKSEMDWSKAFEHLRTYAEREGHARVPKDHVTKDGFKLGAWVTRQRSAYTNKELSSNAKKRLQELPGWISNIRKFKSEMNWSKAFEHLRTYAEQEGHACVPIKYCTQDGFHLAAWVNAQRRAYWRGEMSLKRQRALRKLPGWTWKARTTKYRTAWLEAFHRLRGFVKAQRHSLVPGNYVTEDGYHLGAWVCNQRQAYKQGNLSTKQQQRLENLKGWVWDVNEARWIEGFNCLRKYVQCEGDALVLRRYVQKNGYKLGLWVMAQRQLYRQRRLSKKHQEFLKQLPGWAWNARKSAGWGVDKRWLKRLDYVRKYAKKEGHACVPAGYVTKDGFKLGTWVRDQRYLKKKGELSEDKQNILNELPGWVWVGKRSPTDLTWDEAYELLKEFCENEGSARVHQHYKTEDNYALGVWVGIQRTIYKKGKLSKKKQELLEKLPGWVWNARKDRWPRGYKHLCDYVKSNDTSQVPSDYKTKDGYNLGTWIVTQRAWKRKGLLTTGRQKMLEKLSDWTWGGIVRTPQDWHKSLSSLVEYAKEQGNTNVPQSYATKSAFRLGRWVSHQRYLYKKDKLSPERIKALEKLDGWLWDASKNKKNSKLKTNEVN